MSKKLKAGFIGFMDMRKDPWEQLEQIAKIGYRGSEVADRIITAGNVEENRKRMKALGIEPLTVSTMSSETLAKEGIENMIKRAQALDLERAVVFHGKVYFTKMNKPVPSYDEVMSEIEFLQKCAEACKKEGIKLAYHNHDPEFRISYNGLTVFDMLLAYAPDLWIELDVGWTTYAGLNPVDVLKRISPRLSAVHFKDFIPGPDVQVPLWGSEEKYSMPNFCSLGSGALDVHGCLKACAEIGIEYAIVEQDFMHALTPMEALQVSYLVMKESGLLE
ncbi:MAG: sugar phosphate isomerase/epimerase [Firmicutes bacterium]|nr:sugar phosphate isomerase/epimerase [Bacillota bacterium]